MAAGPLVSSNAALTWISKAAQHLFLEKKKKPAASSEVTRVTGLQLSPVPQHLVYCEKGADSSQLFVWGAEAPHLCSEHLTQTDSCGNGLGLERGWQGHVTSSISAPLSLDCGSGLKGTTRVAMHEQFLRVASW